MMKVVTILAALALGGCANNATFRGSAGTMAGYMAAHKATVGEARSRYDALNADLVRIISLQEQQAELLESDNGAQARAWALGERKGELATVADAARLAPDALVPRQTAQIVPPLDAGKLEEELAAATKTAARLGKPPALRDQAAAVIGIIAGVRDEIVKLKADAAAATDKAGAAAAGTAAAATTDAEPAAPTP